MDRSPGNESTAAPPGQSFGRQLIRVLCTNNPLYLVSAWLVFSGLRASFNTGGQTIETWALLGGLAGYTMLLATAAGVLIRLGRIWEDIRTLVLLVLLMFLAISVSLDEALATDSVRGSMWLVAGLAFATVVSEALLAALGVRLPVAYRIPYYLLLALFFLYPVALAPWVGRPQSGQLQWGLFAFSSVAGLVFLSLLPGIRRGAALVRDNGTPWSWPWYPLSLFLVLAVAVCLRAYYLCLSLHFVGENWSIFGTYFLAPFLAAVNVLWLELGLTMRKRHLVAGALAAPLGWLWLAQAGGRDDAVYLRFIDQFQTSLHATPLFVAMLLALAFFAVAALRRVSGAAEACLATVAAMTGIGPRTMTLGGPFELIGWPLLAVAGLLLISAARRQESLRAMLAALAFAVGSAIELRGTWLMSFGLTPLGEVLPLELLLGALLLVIAMFRDAHARFARWTALILLVWIGGVVSAGHRYVLGSPDWLASAAHLLFWTTIALAYARWLNFHSFYFASAANVGTWGTFALMQSYRLMQARVAGLREISLGLAFFVLAFLVSVWKTRRRSETSNAAASGTA
jgi:hypothetical protein